MILPSVTLKKHECKIPATPNEASVGGPLAIRGAKSLATDTLVG